MNTHKDEEKDEVKVSCEICGHLWVAMYTPMELGTAAELMKKAMCPMCGASSHSIFI